MSGETRPYDPVPKDWPLPRIVEIFPSRTLGGFLTGTLNFSARKAKALMEQGRSDTDAVLQSLGINGPLSDSDV